MNATKQTNINKKGRESSISVKGAAAMLVIELGNAQRGEVCSCLFVFHSFMFVFLSFNFR